MRIVCLLNLLGILALSPNSVPAQQTNDRCNEPVDMMILSIVQDEVRYKAYRSSLEDLGTLEAFGGKVLSLGTRLVAEPEMLEGNWPKNRHTFVIRWPCVEAARSFWDSEAYQKTHLPLRVGAGEFNVAIFPALTGLD
ncbi:MAG: DUF1330 domain-containing protein [Rhodospirillaceae bacterium]